MLEISTFVDHSDVQICLLDAGATSLIAADLPPALDVSGADDGGTWAALHPPVLAWSSAFKPL